MMLIADSLLKEKALEPAYKGLSLVKGGKRQHRNYVKQLSNFAAIKSIIFTGNANWHVWTREGRAVLRRYYDCMNEGGPLP